MNIGITIAHKEPGDSIWTNGIKLNALILARMFKESKKGHDVYLVNRYGNNADSTTPWDTEKYVMISEEEAIEKVDLLFIVGSAVTNKYISRFKSSSNKKIVSYKCGNNYVIETERILFKENLEEYKKDVLDQKYDETWIIPQQEYHNFYYLKTISRSNVKVVPFLWHPEHVDRLGDFINSSTQHQNVQYEPRELKRISIFEPNMNIVKFAMIPILITEEVIRTKYNSIIEYLSITNADNLKKNHVFNNYIKQLDIFKQKKIYAEPRYNTPYFLADHTDIVISHQWGNPLNYAYLDALHFGYPLIHNADMIQDMGYYYRDFNIDEGAEMLIRAIRDHDKDYQAYGKNHAKLLQRYRADNQELIEFYDKLIDELYEPGCHKLGNTYNWKTNLLE